MDDTGIGASVRSALRLHEDLSRGSGRTDRMIKSLVEGTVVFAATDQACRHIRQRVLELRPDLKNVAIRPANSLRQVQEHAQRSSRVPQIALDHTLVWELYQTALQGLAGDLSDLGTVGVAMGPDRPMPVAVQMRRGEG
jgi:hypothetical protein